MNLIVVPTGYMGSGSSAVTDIVKEIDGFEAPNNSFEYVFLHCPCGFFDLEEKLLNNNNAIRSDEAIHTFEERMQSLYNKRNFWVGSYDKLISYNFMNYVEEFINNITTITFPDTYWYYQEEPETIWVQLILYIRKALRKITKGKCNISRPYKYKCMRLAFPTEVEFYGAVKKFLLEIYQDLGIGNNNLILDQLLLPHNLFRISNYFDENIRVIKVERDPRDIFLLNKYVWSKQGSPVPYPTDVAVFCDYYKTLRSLEKPTDFNVLCIRFEDLIYKYENSLNAIYEFLNTNQELHLQRGAYFNPSISINNTQLYNHLNSTTKIREEADIISKRLNDYIYDFPKGTIFSRDTFCELF